MQCHYDKKITDELGDSGAVKKLKELYLGNGDLDDTAMKQLACALKISNCLEVTMFLRAYKGPSHAKLSLTLSLFLYLS